jgi:hypothetical protein
VIETSPVHSAKLELLAGPELFLSPSERIEVYYLLIIFLD